MVLPQQMYAQSAQRLIQSGPMVGYSEMKEVGLWIQTTSAATVEIIYRDSANPSVQLHTNQVMTTGETAFTAHLVADQVQPGKRYYYDVFVNGEKCTFPYECTFTSLPLWRWRTSAPNFRLAAGSCFYVNEESADRAGKPYGKNYQILTNIHKDKPNIMLWLGDNTYLREPDWNTKTGIFHRYTHTRSLPELQPLLASTHHYALWDDHDYGPNDADRGFWNKRLTRQAFDLFWSNASRDVAGTGGITSRFEWGDVEFFLLDDRWDRSPNERTTGKRTLLGEKQLQWLIDALTSSQATFKFIAIGGQVLNPLAKYETYATYPEEQQELLDALSKENIKGVIFLSGDRHHTVLTKLERKDTYPLYDFTISPLTSSAGNRIEKENTLADTTTFVLTQNYALFDFFGEKDNRKFTCTVKDYTGKTLWIKTISASELGYSTTKK